MVYNSGMERYLEKYLLKDLKEKIVFLSGPRQVGKTTLSKQITDSFTYLNYDSSIHRRIIFKGEWARDRDLIIFDEIHKMKKWKSWLKGIYDTEGIPPAMLVTGSARLDIYRKGGDSLAGRYNSFRLHPLTVKEAVANLNMNAGEALSVILKVGGFPEIFLKGSESYAKRWRRTHIDSIIREDLLDLGNVRDIKSIEIMIDLLRERVGSTTSFTSLANDLQVSVPTVKKWLTILENLYVIFPVRPYHKNISRSILKEAKYFLYDTGSVTGDIGAKLENTVANALLRELHFLEDVTGSRVALNYVRDREKNEVDFLAVIDNVPVMLIEVKSSDENFSRALFRFKKMLPGVKGYQVVMNLKKRRSKDGVKMEKVSEFLNSLNFSPNSLPL